MNAVMTLRLILGLVLTCVAAAVAAQQMYRWTDESGRVHITDTPPPPGATNVRALKPGGGPPSPEAAAAPGSFALQRAIKEFPVTLYTAPNCAEPCVGARELLNKRGVPFRETQVIDDDSAADLKKVSGGDQVPVLKVGTSIYKGFHGGAYDSLLDSAGYPAAGTVPPRAQAAPKTPEGFVAPPEPPKPEPLKPEAPPAPPGRYQTR
jgi:glutaredoxin